MNQHGQIGELPKPGPYNKPNDFRNGDGDRKYWSTGTGLHVHQVSTMY